MQREIVLLPTGQVSDDYSYGANNRDPNTSPYTSGSPTKTLAECWGDEEATTYWYHWPHRTAGGVGRVLASWEAPPTLALYKSVKIQAWWDYSQSGPNNWIFPPANAHGPQILLTLRNRAGTGYLYSDPIDIEDGRNQNINTGSPGTYLGPQLSEWEMTAHPEGGPFVIDDLCPAKFAAGVTVLVAAPAFDYTQGSFFKVRVSKVRVVLIVEDLGGYVSNVRNLASMVLRLMRRPRNVVQTSCLASRAVGAVGSRVYLSHPKGPAVWTKGWGARRLERRPGVITQRRILPESFTVEDEIFDTQSLRCLAWAAYRIDGPWSPELQGLAYIDKGGGFTHTRAQDGWSKRPGDGMLMRVLENYPNLCTDGLAAQGGGDVAICLRNYDLYQAGWSTVAATGDFAVAASTTVSMVEELGYLSSASLTFGAGGGTGGRERSLGTLDYNAGDYLNLRVVVRNASVPTPASQFLEVQLYRTGGGLPAAEYWDEANRAWTAAGAVNNPIPSDEPSGEVIFDAVPTDALLASSDPTYYVRVGRFSSALTNCSFYGAIVDAQKGGASWGGAYGARTPLVTLAAEITRVADVHRITNSATPAAEVCGYDRGVAMVEARPFWRAEVLPNNTVKPLLHAYHAASTWDAIQFVAKTGSDDLIRFERAVSGQTTFQLDCPIPGLDLNRGHVLRAWARWLGADGWTEYGPYSVEVGWAVFVEATDALVASGSAVGALSYTGAMATRAWLGIGNDDQGRYADCYIRAWETRRNPLSGLECIWRL